MAVKIKLMRMGKIRAPYYRIVVADARTKRDGRAIEQIGKYHPKQEPSLIEIDSVRAQHWLSRGAQPTDPVRSLLKVTGDWQKFRGEPGAEGTLKAPAARQPKKEAFAAALKEVHGESDAEAARPKSRGRKADTGKAEKAAEKPAKAGRTGKPAQQSGAGSGAGPAAEPEAGEAAAAAGTSEPAAATGTEAGKTSGKAAGNGEATEGGAAAGQPGSGA